MGDLLDKAVGKGLGLGVEGGDEGARVAGPLLVDRNRLQAPPSIRQRWAVRFKLLLRAHAPRGTKARVVKQTMQRLTKNTGRFSPESSKPFQKVGKAFFIERDCTSRFGYAPAVLLFAGLSFTCLLVGDDVDDGVELVAREVQAEDERGADRAPRTEVRAVPVVVQGLCKQPTGARANHNHDYEFGCQNWMTSMVVVVSVY